MESAARRRAVAGPEASIRVAQPAEPERRRPGPWPQSAWLLAAVSVALLALLAGGLRYAWPRGRMPAAPVAPAPHDGPFPFSIYWYAPFFSGGGYSTEAIELVLGLANSSAMTRPGGPRVRIAQHGDGVNRDFVALLAPDTRASLQGLLMRPGERPAPDAIVVCHSEPGAWSAPHALFETPQCPPAAGGALVIGRTVFETDRLAAEHVKRCNRLDGVLVPTAWAAAVFKASGVEEAKLAVVAEAVDVDAFTPDGPRLALPIGARVFGPPLPEDGTPGRPIVWFVSVFKWEHRKGWDVLLRAYLSEFGPSDDVGLILLTSPYHGRPDFAAQMAAFAARELSLASANATARVWVQSTPLSGADLASLYRAARALVQPSRGEGWGRPHAESMACGTPVIATDWGGTAAFMSRDNGYPLPVERLVTVGEGPWAGHQWAEPAVPKLRALMRRAAVNPGEAATKGRRAREDMVREYTRERVAADALGALRRIAAARGRTV